jgi:hypothetical protein
LDIVLETLRRGYRAEASVDVYNNACARNWASTDASNKGSGEGGRWRPFALGIAASFEDIQPLVV